MRLRSSPTVIGVSMAIVSSVMIAEAAANDSVVVVGDAVVAPLTRQVGSVARGREVALNRQVGNCLVCHAVPSEPTEMAQGNVGPALAGVGKRLSEGQLRLRLIDQSRLNTYTIMPPYYRTVGLTRVASQFVGKPILDALQIEDVIAYLVSLKE